MTNVSQSNHRFFFSEFLGCLALCLVVILGSRRAVSENERPTSAEQKVSFVNDIVPVFTKFGCNAGVCHAKAGGGQNGFQLSLLGFEPQEDFESLVKEGRGRRLFPAFPEQSLLLQKATGQVPHGGGVRFADDSHEYALILDWIRQGARFKTDQEPTLIAVEVEPKSGRIERGSSLQLKALAKYSDGTKRDVTRMALYESNTPSMVEVTGTGKVTTKTIPGRIAVMVRYQGQTSVFTAAVPLGPKLSQTLTPNNFIDNHIFSNLAEIGISPSKVCDDSTFIRRVTLDIAGRLPTEKETQLFLESSEADKRNQLIDSLLRSPGYADFLQASGLRC